MSRAVRANYDQIFLLPRALDEWIPAEHPARFIRDFVDELPLETLGLKTFPGKEGRPHYAPDMLLKVWLYGWMTRVRSSRGLEKACFESMPFLWLTGNHHPDHNTLWRFFRDNKKALRKLFKLVVQVAVKSELVGFALHALDGTKIVAACSMEKALHRKALEDELKKLDATIDFDLDIATMHMVKAVASSQGSFSIMAKGASQAAMEDRFKGRTTVKLESRTVAKPAVATPKAKGKGKSATK